MKKFQAQKSIQFVHFVGGTEIKVDTEIKVGTEFKVGTKFKKYGTVINAEINVAVIFCLPDKCCNKILLDWFSPGWGFSKVTLTKILLLYGFISLLFLCVFPLLQT